MSEFLDLEARVSHDEGEEEEEEEQLSDLFNDAETSSDGLGDVPYARFAGSVVQDLEDEARRIAEKATRADTTETSESLALPFRVPCDTDPSIWSVKVQVSREYDVVLQICRRCLEPSESRPPAITSAFARTSIPGYVFIEAYDISEVRCAVKGFVLVKVKDPKFIARTDYVRLLSRDSSSPVEVGQWVRCLFGLYRDDLGFVSDVDEWHAIVIFVPRIPKPTGKRSRNGRPPPRTWTTAEIVHQYGDSVEAQGPNKLVLRGRVYEDGLVKERVPISHLRVSNRSPMDITPFVRSNMLRTETLFDACIKRFAQDSTQVGDRILVVSGEQAGIVGLVERIQDNVADVVAQGPKENSGLVIGVVLRDLMPHFVVGDHVKDRWSDRVGIVLAVDDDNKVSFLNKQDNEEIVTSTLDVQFYSFPPCSFKISPGLYVEFPGTDVTRRGRVLQASDGSVKIIDEKDGRVFDVNEDKITVSGVQAPTLSSSKHSCVWEEKRVVVTKGPFKGYRGLVKAQYDDGVDVELDARQASFGSGTQRLRVEDVALECLFDRTVLPAASSSRSKTPPPPEVSTRLTPEPEEPEESIPWSTTVRRPTRNLWLFVEQLYEILGDRCIPFHIRDLPMTSPHHKYEGLTAKTVSVAKRKISPRPNEVVMSVAQGGRPKQISIDPSFLVPWTPTEGNQVIIVGDRRMGQVGKVERLFSGRGCSVALQSNAVAYFSMEDVVNII